MKWLAKQNWMAVVMALSLLGCAGCGETALGLLVLVGIGAAILTHWEEILGFLGAVCLVIGVLVVVGIILGAMA